MSLDLEALKQLLIRVHRDIGYEVGLTGFKVDDGGKDCEVAGEERVEVLSGRCPLIPADGKREDGEDSELPRAHGTLGFSFTFALGG